MAYLLWELIKALWESEIQIGDRITIIYQNANLNRQF